MRKGVLHIVFWIVFFLVWDQVVYFYISDVGNRLYFSAFDVSLIICGFYGVYAWMLPGYFKHKSKSRLIVGSLILIGLLAGLYSWGMQISLHHMLVPIHFEFNWNYKDLQLNRVFIALLGVLGGFFVKLAMDRQIARRKMERMEKEKSLAELTYLKAQINPHFLFNSLNSLHAQLEFDGPEARHTLVAIADLLRYQLYECSADFVGLAKELEYLNNYFTIQRLRIENCNVLFSADGDFEHEKIAPLLLMPFVENAFKYLSDSDVQENTLVIKLTVNNHQLHFFCENTINETAVEAERSGKGIGLENVRKRLELLYEDRYRLETKVSGRSYIVKLEVNL